MKYAYQKKMQSQFFFAERQNKCLTNVARRSARQKGQEEKTVISRPDWNSNDQNRNIIISHNYKNVNN
jgi:hypothetical protein